MLIWNTASRYQFSDIRVTPWKRQTGRQVGKRTRLCWKSEPRSCTHSHSFWNQAPRGGELYSGQSPASRCCGRCDKAARVWPRAWRAQRFIRSRRWTSQQDTFPKCGSFGQGDTFPFSCPSVENFYSLGQLPSFSTGTPLAKRLLMLVMTMDTQRKDNKWNVSSEIHSFP